MQGIIDITVGLGPQTVLMDSSEGMGDFRYRKNSIDDGDFFNGSVLKDFTAHAGEVHVKVMDHELQMWHVQSECLQGFSFQNHMRGILLRLQKHCCYDKAHSNVHGMQAHMWMPQATLSM